MAATTTASPIPTTGINNVGNSGMAEPAVRVMVFRSYGAFCPVAPVLSMTDQTLMVTVPEVGAVHCRVHWDTVIGDIKWFGVTCVEL